MSAIFIQCMHDCVVDINISITMCLYKNLEIRSKLQINPPFNIICSLLLLETTIFQYYYINWATTNLSHMIFDLITLIISIVNHDKKIFLNYLIIF